MSFLRTMLRRNLKSSSTGPTPYSDTITSRVLDTNSPKPLPTVSDDETLGSMDEDSAEDQVLSPDDIAELVSQNVETWLQDNGKKYFEDQAEAWLRDFGEPLLACQIKNQLRIQKSKSSESILKKKK